MLRGEAISPERLDARRPIRSRSAPRARSSARRITGPATLTRKRPIMRIGIHGTAALLLLAAAAHLAPSPLEAQYFGRNKVQYEDFDFQVMSLPHWDLYFYPGQEESIQDVARMSERWYERFARTF